MKGGGGGGGGVGGGLARGYTHVVLALCIAAMYLSYLACCGLKTDKIIVLPFPIQN